MAKNWKVSRGVALEKELWDKIDEVRGAATASAYIRGIVMKELGVE